MRAEEKLFPKLVKHKALLNFFITAFEESTGLTDEMSAREYVAGFTPKEHKQLIIEGKLLLASHDLPYEETSKAANRYFASEEDGFKWITKIISAIERVKTSKGRWFVISFPKEMKKYVRQKYPRLNLFFSTEMLRPKRKGYSDEETARRYIMKTSLKMRTKMVEEIDTLLQDNTIQWDELNKKVSVHFISSEDFRDWLRMVQGILNLSINRKNIKDT